MKATARALQIFELVATSGPIGVSDIARRVDVPKSTVQRHLMSLDEAGWIRAVGDDSTKWAATPRAIGLSRRGSTEGTIASIARTHMIRLRDQISETVTLVVPDTNHQIVHIERVDSLQVVLATIDIGVVAPITSSSGGLSILANLPAAAIDEVLSRPIAKLTDETVVDPQRIYDYLPHIRQQGYAVSRGQLRPGVRAIGSAVFDDVNAPVGAVAVSFPRARFVEEKVPEWGATIRAIADEISAGL